MPRLTLSIITVCYNARESLLSTMENILGQTWTQFEHLIIDGNSGDGTKELLEQMTEKYAQKGIPFSFTSEPDHGIYDAMNKGTRLARGEWLLFLNAGDRLVHAEVLADLFQEEKAPDARILYGDTVCIYQGRRKLYPVLPLDHLPCEMAFCHQSAFIRQELLLQHPYDISYRVCADHHFFLAMYLHGETFSYTGFPVAQYEISGFSDLNTLSSHREKMRMQKELGVFRFSVAWLGREICFYGKQALKKIGGQKLIDAIRKIYLRG